MRRRPLWKRWWFWVPAIIVIAVTVAVIGRRNAPQPVEIVTVAAAYPSASISVLNATGRVVAARRASVSSKGTGRLEWLGVQEGQRVSGGDIIARLENRDVAAEREQAAAQVQVARANLAQGEAELEDAASAFEGFLSFTQSLPSAAVYDTIKDAKLVGDIHRYRFSASVWRRYDQMKVFPERLIPIGDTLCNFDPLFGPVFPTHFFVAQ